MPCHPPLHILTGGPGSGKSSLLAVLAQADYSVAEEAGRAISAISSPSQARGFPGATRACSPN
nr:MULTISPECIES: AAA family ATPase [unclassified Pseudomonas]